MIGTFVQGVVVEPFEAELYLNPCKSGQVEVTRRLLPIVIVMAHRPFSVGFPQIRKVGVILLVLVRAWTSDTFMKLTKTYKKDSQILSNMDRIRCGMHGAH